MEKTKRTLGDSAKDPSAKDMNEFVGKKLKMEPTSFYVSKIQLLALDRIRAERIEAGAGFGPIVNRRGEEIDRLEPNLKPGLFVCYRMPPIVGKAAQSLMEYTQEKYDPESHPQGEVKWYFRDAETGKITELPESTWTASAPQASVSTMATISSSMARRLAISLKPAWLALYPMATPGQTCP